MSFTTRCPACGTIFRVVPDQLKISDGWVRCGHCADVFDASLHLEAWKPPTPVVPPERADPPVTVVEPDEAPVNAASVASRPEPEPEPEPEPSVAATPADRDPVPPAGQETQPSAFLANGFVPPAPMAGDSGQGQQPFNHDSSFQSPTPAPQSWPAQSSNWAPNSVDPVAPSDANGGFQQPSPAPGPVAAPVNAAPNMDAQAAGLVPSWVASAPDPMQQEPTVAEEVAGDWRHPTGQPFSETESMPLASADQAAPPFDGELRADGTEGSPFPAETDASAGLEASLPTPPPEPLPAPAPAPVPVPVPVPVPGAGMEDVVGLSLPSPESDAVDSDYFEELERFASATSGAARAIASEAEEEDEQADRAPDPEPPFAEEAAEASLPSVEPGFVRQARRQAFWRSPAIRVLLLGVALLLGTLLAAQWAVQERDRLAARYPGSVPVLTWLCEPMQCELGAPQRIESVVIDSSNLVRRIGNFYSFDFVVKNSEPIALAMPALELSLTDGADAVIARRVFLQDELPGMPKVVPASGSISISLRLSLAESGIGAMTGYRALVFYP